MPFCILPTTRKQPTSEEEEEEMEDHQVEEAAAYRICYNNFRGDSRTSKLHSVRMAITLVLVMLALAVNKGISATTI
jgi:hypothetical protein